MDFTLTSYKQLISTLQAQGFFFQTFEGFIQNPKKKVLILRHDVDRLPGNALRVARVENGLGIRATYFFRTIPETFKPQIIKEIAELGHEIGYHYENLSEIGRNYLISHRHTQTHTDIYPADFAGQKESSLRENNKYCDKLYELAIEDFRLNLEKFRKLYPVKTICMHGSPLSKYDNKKLWEKYDYRDYGIIAEPYFDVDFNEVFYLSDTGRSWNNSDASVRDKVNSGFDIKIKNTNDLIQKIENGELPDKIMINTHPQRWTNDYVPWVKELVGQNFKNIIKKWMIKFKK